MPRPMLIDTDAGSDDAVAIVMALRHSDIDVRAITVVAGNVPLEQGVVNSLYFAELCAADAPVYAGADRPADARICVSRLVPWRRWLGRLGRPLPAQAN